MRSVFSEVHAKIYRSDQTRRYLNNSSRWHANLSAPRGWGQLVAVVKLIKCVINLAQETLVSGLLLGVTVLVPCLDSSRREVVSRQSLKINLVLMLKGLICASRKEDWCIADAWWWKNIVAYLYRQVTSSRLRWLWKLRRLMSMKLCWKGFILFYIMNKFYFIPRCLFLSWKF